jgi:hypothetical protein
MRKCPRSHDLARLRTRSIGPSLRGDVNGDGTVDRISVRAVLNAPVSCGFFVVATSRKHVYSSVIPMSNLPQRTIRSLLKMQGAVSGAAPVVSALVPVEPGRGLVVAVTVEHGASMGSAALFSTRGNRLVRLRIKGKYPDNTLAYDGVVTTMAGVDCVAPNRSGRIVAGDYFLLPGSITPGTERWGLRRTFYRVVGTTLRVTRKIRRTLAGPASRARLQPPEFRGSALFPSCAAVRAPWPPLVGA